MADLCGTNAGSPSLESEDMSSLLHNLLHGSLTSQPPSSASFKKKHEQLFSSPATTPTLAATSDSTTNLSSRLPVFSYSDCRFGEGTSTAGSSVMVDSSTGFNFSDPGLGFMADAEDCTRDTFSSACAVDSDAITSTLKGEFTTEKDGDDLGFDSKKGNEVSEAPMNPVPSRSSKRSRAAEVHNLSEKRRRSRINEKMKALQNLIPNSNKTDKASMLDEAIEYLKHLQLQVQMLSMRNGLSPHPFCLPGSLHPPQLPQPAIGFDGGNEMLNSKGGEDTFSGNQAILMRAAFELPNQCTLSNQPNFMSPVTNIANSETSLGLDPLIQNHYEPFNYLTTSEVNSHEDKSSQLQLDMSCSRKKSSSGVPS